MTKTFWRAVWARQSSPLFGCLIAACLAGNPAWAQDSQTTYIDIPTTSDTDAYRDATRRARLQDDISYIDETGEDLLADTARETEPRPAERDRDIYLPTGAGGPGVFIVVALFAVALILLFKFGAGGTLLRGDPKNTDKKTKPAQDWGLKPDDIPEGDLLSQIKGMADRREALILLLRYCLLRAAELTETNFRRADTEREALARLPQQWPLFANLRRLLMQTELVHYGGRDIDDESYTAALKDGAEILIKGGSRGR